MEEELSVKKERSSTEEGTILTRRGDKLDLFHWAPSTPSLGLHLCIFPCL